MLARGARRVPVLKRLPLVRLLAIGEIVLLAREHFEKLDPSERRRLVELVRRGRNLSPPERSELAVLVAKADPRLFAGLVAEKLSPVGLPQRFVHGPAKR